MQNPADQKKWIFKGFLISFTGAILFSMKAIIIKKAFHATSVDAVTLLALRLLIALPFYVIVAVWQTRKEDQVSLTRRQWLFLIALGLLGYYFSSYFDFVGLQYISAGLERLILFLYPSFAVLINFLAYKQKITTAQSWALFLTYLGIGIAYFGELKIDTGNPNFYWGSLLIFLCAVAYAFYLSGSGKMIPITGPARFTSYTLIVATSAILLHFVIRMLASGDTSGLRLLGSNPTLWGYGAALAIVTTVLPTFMISAGMKRIGPNNAAIVTSIGPVSTIIQAHIFLNEKIFPEQLIGTGLVIIGVLLIGRKSSQTQADTDPAVVTGSPGLTEKRLPNDPDGGKALGIKQ